MRPGFVVMYSGDTPHLVWRYAISLVIVLRIGGAGKGTGRASVGLSSFRALDAEDPMTAWHWRIEMYNQKLWLSSVYPGPWAPTFPMDNPALERAETVEKNRPIMPSLLLFGARGNISDLRIISFWQKH
ncbi:hypothetical protein TNCV_2623521 [Trichonephila clavipes]|nr:hypothetical protein TNCV_2623521 [Trichonephila clavipes]